MSDDQILRKLEKQSKENHRILKEFPGLWGIRQKWALVFDRLSVTKADETLGRFLHNTNPDPAAELWAYVINGRQDHSVFRIEGRGPKQPYARRLREYLIASKCELEYLALVHKVRRTLGTSLDYIEIRIYRPRSKEESLETFLQVSDKVRGVS